MDFLIVPALPPLAMADMYAGIYGAFGVLAALRNVEHGDGKGQVVDVALFESLYSTLASKRSVSSNRHCQPSDGAAGHQYRTRNIYACADGKFLALSASVQSMLKTLHRLSVVRN